MPGGRERNYYKWTYDIFNHWTNCISEIGFGSENGNK